MEPLQVAVEMVGEANRALSECIDELQSEHTLSVQPLQVFILIKQSNSK